jgi:hypothetical protein
MSQHVQERVSLGAFVDRAQHEALHELARREDRSISSLVRIAVSDYLAKPRREQLLEQMTEIRARASGYKPIVFPDEKEEQ